MSRPARTLDGKTGLLTGLLTGIQGWKCPVALSQTCYGSKSLKVILMDSNFGGHPVPNTLCRLLQTCRKIGVHGSSEEHLHPVRSRKGLQNLADSGNSPSVCLLWQKVSCLFCSSATNRWGKGEVECHMDPTITKASTGKERLVAACAESQSTSRGPNRTRFLAVSTGGNTCQDTM